jgi:hypothetical protein
VPSGSRHVGRDDVAKHDKAHEARTAVPIARSKEYIALVWGEVMAGRRIDADRRDPVNRKKMSAVGARAQDRRATAAPGGRNTRSCARSISGAR